MITVLSCIYIEHNLALVALAAALCLMGSFVTMRLLRRCVEAEATHRFGWSFLAAVSGGGSVWATHFVAMLAYEPNAPVSFDAAMTILSLVIAIVGLILSFSLSAFTSSQILKGMAGALVGLSFAAMHYVGMFAYRIVGLMDWKMDFVWASIILSVVFAALSNHVIWKFKQRKLSFWIAVGAMVLGIVGLHFTGMAAITVTPMAENFPALDANAMVALATAIALVTLIILGTGLTSHLIDSKVRNHSQKQLHHMSHHDALTGLPNREGFRRYIQGAVESAEHYDVKVAILRININRFTEINDRLGHAAGDKALQTIALRFKAIQQEDEYVARTGGDEFVAVKFFRDRSMVVAYAERLTAEISDAIHLGKTKCVLDATMGGAIWPDDADTTSDLVNNADLAMHTAKFSFMNKVCFYDANIGSEMRAKRRLAEDLRIALEHDELELHYQVQTSLEADCDIQGFEALLRWTHPELGPISPASFIPVAEENGLIAALGEWVLRRACMDAANWYPSYRVAVNVSAVQFANPHLPQLVEEVLKETGLAPDLLELELTETALVKDIERSLKIMKEVKALGVGIALDDFGTGYSSLEILRTFPIDKIKLDKSFVDDIEQDPQSLAIVRAVLILGKSLEIPVLAEGIETQDQMAILRKEGCDEGQGVSAWTPVFGQDAD